METTQVVNFRREVLRRIAEYTWNDCLPEHIYDILYNTVKDNTSRVRCIEKPHPNGVVAAPGPQYHQCGKSCTRWGIRQKTPCHRRAARCL